MKIEVNHSLRLIQLNCWFWGEPANPYLLSQTKFAPPPLPSACIKTKQQCKRNGEKPACILNIPILSLTIFSFKPSYLLSQTNFLPCCYRHPFVLIKTEQRCKKNGEKPLHIFNFSVLSLTIYSNKLLFLSQMCNLWYRSPQTKFCPTTNATHLHLLKLSGE